METRTNYIRRLQDGLEELYACSAQHAESARVREIFRGEIIWQGTVEVFDSQKCGDQTGQQLFHGAEQLFE